MQPGRTLSWHKACTGSVQRYGFKGEGENQEIITQDVDDKIGQAALGESGDKFETRSVGNRVIQFEKNSQGEIVDQQVIAQSESGGGGFSSSELEAQRNITTEQFLQQNLDPETGQASPSSYVEAQQKYISNGGTTEEFLGDFPPSLYLSESQIKSNLPQGWQDANEGVSISDVTL